MRLVDMIDEKKALYNGTSNHVKSNNGELFL